MTNTADLLEQIPDLGEDVKDPEDCFTEGTAPAGTTAQPQPCAEGQEDPELLRHNPLWPGCLSSFPLSSRPWGPPHLPVT